MAKSPKKIKKVEQSPLNLPQMPTLTPEVQEKMDKLKVKLDKYKTEVLKKFDKYIAGISLLPPPQQKQADKMYPLQKPVNKDEVHIFTLVDDSDVKKMSRHELIVRLTDITNKIAADIDKNFKPQVMLISEIKDACFDGKYDLLKMIASAGIVFDKGILGALKVAEVHRTKTIQKFEKYVVGYIAFGSLFRGDANTNDIDVAIIIDDTDVKKMSRLELRDKLRAIIQNLGFEASQITGVKAHFHIQTYILTDFWESVKDANPVIFTILRDGVPLYDRGVFMPWKLLLQMGRIKPSPEAIDMNMEVGEKLLTRTRQKLLSVVGEDLYYALLNPAQAALMLYGLPPPTHKETAPLLDEIFVKKEKLLEKKYVDMLSRAVKYFKDIEHGKVKSVTGKEIDSLLKDADEYLNSLKKLFTEIEKRKEKEGIIEIHKTCIRIAKDILADAGVKVTDANVVKQFKDTLVKKEKLPEQYVTILEDVIKAKKEYASKKMSKQELNKVQKEAKAFIRAMVDLMQRKKMSELEKVKIRFKYGKDMGEVTIINNTAFIVKDIEKREEILKANISKDGSLGNAKKTSLEEFEKYLNKISLPQKIFIKDKIFQSLNKLIGKDVEFLLGY
ncbi:hypothetical protein CL616_01685 [archaeon]|nr:hypothetical protein [archaeon]